MAADVAVVAVAVAGVVAAVVTDHPALVVAACAAEVLVRVMEGPCEVAFQVYCIQELA